MVSQLPRLNLKIANYNQSFNYLTDVYEECLKQYLEHPQSINTVLKSINNGRKILQSDSEVCTYIAFYGAQHYYKLVKEKVETVAKLNFNSVLVNLYRNGQDYVSWHSDDEPELGNNPTIASVSFGATRRFVLRHKSDRDLNKVEEALTHGSLLIMQGTTQHFWQHQVPKTAKKISPRINLTFRIIK